MALPSQDAAAVAVEAVDPVICWIVRSKLRASLSASDGREHNLDALDVLGDIRLKILRRVAGEGTAAIASLQSYAATVAYHTCADYLRAKYPARTRVRNAIRRMLGKTAGFAIWQSMQGRTTGDWLCGFATSNAPPAVIDGIALPARFSSDPSSPEGLEILCRHVFREAGGPVLLDDLVSWIQRSAGGGTTDLDRAAELPGDTAAPPRAAASDAHWLAVERMRLLWDAVQQLLPWHRAAYLLNLREGELDAFPYYGIASIGDLQAVLELKPDQELRMAEAFGVNPSLPPQERFAACWRNFPVEDQVLAGILGVERSQVIAYRNKAIERLRRMLSALR